MFLHDVMKKSQALAARVKRYHSWPTLNSQSTGEHQHRVTTLFVELFGMPRVEVLWTCLNHDQGEFKAGDTPFGAKRDVPELKMAVDLAEQIGLKELGIDLPELTPVEQVQVKIADILEMMEFGLLEINMGNHFAHPIVEKTEIAITVISKDHPHLQEIALKWIENAKMEWLEW